MKRNPGQWLRSQIRERGFRAILIFGFGVGWLTATVITTWSGLPIGPTVLFGVGACICAIGLWRILSRIGKTTESWRFEDMRKGAHSEERIGAAIEYALTQPYCAVAHGVKDIAKVGDIDHLIATPQRIWVVESKYRRLPRNKFPETLGRIATNVDAVSKWVPDTQVIGCLVFSGVDRISPKSSYSAGNRHILCFKHPESLAQALRAESGIEPTIPEEVVQRVWQLGRTAESE